nr:unnamed protein product [Callosobruchus analis]
MFSNKQERKEPEEKEKKSGKGRVRNKQILKRMLKGTLKGKENMRTNELLCCCKPKSTAALGKKQKLSNPKKFNSAYLRVAAMPISFGIDTGYIGNYMCKRKTTSPEIFLFVSKVTDGLGQLQLMKMRRS